MCLLSYRKTSKRFDQNNRKLGLPKIKCTVSHHDLKQIILAQQYP